MEVLDRLRRVDQDVFRNIASLRRSEDLFDDLVSDAPGQASAIAADLAVRDSGIGVIERGLYYSQAIAYPFTSDKTVESRFGDGTVRVWYGALELETAVAETCWHALEELQAIPDLTNTAVVRYRAVYAVRAQGLFADLVGKERDFPWLVGDDYSQTQAVGKYAAHQGLHGLVYPSARRAEGTCLAAFKAEPLSSARLSHYLTYRIDVATQVVTIERTPGQVEQVLHKSDLRRR